MSALCWCVLAWLRSNGRSWGLFRHIQLTVTGLEGISNCKVNLIFCGMSGQDYKSGCKGNTQGAARGGRTDCACDAASVSRIIGEHERILPCVGWFAEGRGIRCPTAPPARPTSCGGGVQRIRSRPAKRRCSTLHLWGGRLRASCCKKHKCGEFEFPTGPIG